MCLQTLGRVFGKFKKNFKIFKNFLKKLLTLYFPYASIALSLIKKSLDCNHRHKQNIDNCIFLDIQISVKMMSNVSTHTNQLS